VANSGGPRHHLDTPPPLAALAARQHGVVATRQLLTLGYSPTVIARLVRDGHLIRLHRGVYAVGHIRLSARGRWMAAALACGDDAVLSHRAASALWDLSQTPAGAIDVTAPGHSRRRIPGVHFHGARTLHPDDREIIDGIPVTALPRTMLDQATAVNPQRLRTLLEQAQRRDLVNPLAFDALLARSPGHHGAGRLRAALSELQDDPPWTQSELERRFLEFLRTRHLPEPRTNVPIDGILADCFWPEHNLVAELDSYRFHRDRRTFESDREKGIVHARAGRQAIHITQRMLTRQAQQLEMDLRALLGTPSS
jgi:Transcriptional regulator, AbiEi antitoxin